MTICLNKSVEMFSHSLYLTEVTLPSWLEVVPVGMFSGCKKLAKVTIPEGIEENSLNIQRYVINLKAFDENQLLAADVNGDGKVTAKDALEILRYTLNLSDNDNIGKIIT